MSCSLFLDRAAAGQIDARDGDAQEVAAVARASTGDRGDATVDVREQRIKVAELVAADVVGRGEVVHAGSGDCAVGCCEAVADQSAEVP